jgi:hypothetical protein
MLRGRHLLFRRLMVAATVERNQNFNQNAAQPGRKYPHPLVCLFVCLARAQQSTAQQSRARVKAEHHTTAPQSRAEHSRAQHSTQQSTAQQSRAQQSTAEHSTQQGTAEHSRAQHSRAQHTAEHSRAQQMFPSWMERSWTLKPAALRETVTICYKGATSLTQHMKCVCHRSVATLRLTT